MQIALGFAYPLGFTPMKFTLTYDGQLPSAGNSSKRLHEKWEIRRALHPQLAELWKTDPILSHVAEYRHYGTLGDLSRFQTHHSKPKTPPSKGGSEWFVDLLEPIVVAGKGFVPLVRESLALVCGLDILFLRKEDPGSLIKQGGDIDNRLKTLFDGLRKPSRDEMDLSSNDDPDPFYCLLEEDSLISDVSIRTDRLLSKPESNPSEVRLIITVTLKVTQVRLYNIVLMS